MEDDDSVESAGDSGFEVDCVGEGDFEPELRLYAGPVRIVNADEKFKSKCKEKDL